MSYFTLEENLKVENPPQKINLRHSGKPHSPESKKKIADAQKARYEQMRRAAQCVITEERMKEIIKETIDEYIAKNVTPVNNNKPNIPL